MVYSDTWGVLELQVFGVQERGLEKGIGLDFCSSGSHVGSVYCIYCLRIYLGPGMSSSHIRENVCNEHDDSKMLIVNEPRPSRSCTDHKPCLLSISSLVLLTTNSVAHVAMMARDTMPMVC